MYLSKSLYMTGLSCPRALWVTVHDPSRLPPIDAATQALFDSGHEVGDWAKRRYPNGVEIDRGSGATAVTRRSLEKGVPLFEASFSFGECYCKTDILIPVGDKWDIIEVKASTSVKEEHLLDVAFQRYVVEGAGVPVRNVYVLYVNNKYVRHGDIDVDALFVMEDVTASIDLNSVPSNVARLLTVLSGDEPSPLLGVDCLTPGKCPVCMPKSELLYLYRINSDVWSLLNNGVSDFSSLPASFILNDKQKIQVEAHTTGKVHVDKKRLSDWLSSLVYPLYILDFETFSTAVPMFDGVRPYENVPFQFSLHVVGIDGSVVHHSFLAKAFDPRAEVANALSVIGASGSVLAHNATFERSVLSGLAALFSYDWLKSAVTRLVDTITPFREFWYYSPLQKGSCSLKAILPALTGSGYEGMDICNGWAASSEYVRVTYGSVTDEERERVRASLLLYCEKDTASVIEVLERLKREI